MQATFGQPARIATVGPYTVLIYGKNLLAELPATWAGATMAGSRLLSGYLQLRPVG